MTKPESINWDITKEEFVALHSKITQLQNEINALGYSNERTQKMRLLEELNDEIDTYPWEWPPGSEIMAILYRHDELLRFAYSTVPDDYQGVVTLELYTEDEDIELSLQFVFANPEEGKLAAIYAIECLEFYGKALLRVEKLRCDSPYQTAHAWRNEYKKAVYSLSF